MTKEEVERIANEASTAVQNVMHLGFEIAKLVGEIRRLEDLQKKVEDAGGAPRTS